MKLTSQRDVRTSSSLVHRRLLTSVVRINNLTPSERPARIMRNNSDAVCRSVNTRKRATSFERFHLEMKENQEKRMERSRTVDRRRDGFLGISVFRAGRAPISGYVGGPPR